MTILPPYISSAGVPRTTTRASAGSSALIERDGGADAGSGDEVVAAGVADLGQRVVLGADGDGDGPWPHSPRNAVSMPYAPACTLKPCASHERDELGAGVAFFVREFRVRVDLARDADEFVARGIDGGCARCFAASMASVMAQA